MRIEVDVLDNSPEADILRSVGDPKSYVLDLIRADRGERAVEKKSPDYSWILSQADLSQQRFQTRAEIDEYLNQLRAEW